MNCSRRRSIYEFSLAPSILPGRRQSCGAVLSITASCFFRGGAVERRAQLFVPVLAALGQSLLTSD